jgi:hypothetical protein
MWLAIHSVDTCGVVYIRTNVTFELLVSHIRDILVQIPNQRPDILRSFWGFFSPSREIPGTYIKLYNILTQVLIH